MLKHKSCDTNVEVGPHGMGSFDTIFLRTPLQGRVQKKGVPSLSSQPCPSGMLHVGSILSASGIPGGRPVIALLKPPLLPFLTEVVATE